MSPQSSQVGQRNFGHVRARQRQRRERDGDLLAAHRVAEGVAGVLPPQLRPGGQQLAGGAGERLGETADLCVERSEGCRVGLLLLKPRPLTLSLSPREKGLRRLHRRCRPGDLLEQVPEIGVVGASVRGGKDRPRTGELVELARHQGLLLGSRPRVAARACDLSKVAHTVSRDQRMALRVARGVGVARSGLPTVAAVLLQPSHQREEERVDALVVELMRAGWKHRECVVGGRKVVPAAAQLLAHVAQRVQRPGAIELVDRHQVGEVEHVDLLELHRGAVLGRHHVERDVGEVGDLAVRLTGARRLHDHQVEAGSAADVDRRLHVCRQRAVRLPGGERAHVDSVRAERVHANAVAEQGAAGAPLGRVHRQHRDAEIGEVGEEAPYELVGERGLAGPAGPGDADDRGPGVRAPGLARRGDLAGLGLGDQAGHGVPV